MLELAIEKLEEGYTVDDILNEYDLLSHEIEILLRYE